MLVDYRTIHAIKMSSGPSVSVENCSDGKLVTRRTVTEPFWFYARWAAMLKLGRLAVRENSRVSHEIQNFVDYQF